MRLALIIAFSAAVGVALVNIRRKELRASHEIQRLQMVQLRLRRRLWDQQVQLGYLTAPDQVRRRAEEMCLDVTRLDPSSGQLANRRSR